MNPWPMYHEALGRFLCEYAETEIVLHIILRSYVEIDRDVLVALTGAPSTGDLIKKIKDVTKSLMVSQSILDENEVTFKQLSEIATMRNLLIHRKTEHYNGIFYVHDVWTSKRHEPERFHEVSPQLINNMLMDIKIIDTRLFHVNSSSMKIPYSKAALAGAFPPAWRYKPSPPKTRDQVEQTKAPQ
jgi:hypothetical protein